MNERSAQVRMTRPTRASVLVSTVAAIVLQAAAASCAGEGPVPGGRLTLQQCVAIALRQNPQILSSEQGVVSARAGLVRARSDYYPQLSLSMTEGVTSRTSFLALGGGTFSFRGATRREDTDVVLRQTFWQIGRKEQVEESKYSLRAAEYDRAATVQEVVEQVATDYYAALAAEQLVAVAEAGVASARSHLEQVEARVAAGAAADVDIYPAQDDLARAELDLIDARGAVRQALARLKNTMAVTPETSLELADMSGAEVQDLPTLEAALAVAIERRPEVLSAAAALRASDRALKQAKLRRVPAMGVSGQYTQGYTNWEARDPSWNMLLTLSWPLFDGFARRADETAANASLKRAQADRERMISQVGLEVENVLVESERSRERVAASAKSVAAAEARLTAAESKYQHGVGILIEVIDARVAVTRARADQVRARYDSQIALVGLDRALGTLAVPNQQASEDEPKTL